MRCSEPKQPLRLSNFYRPAFAVVVHVAERALRLGVALLCSDPKQPPRLGKVYRPACAVVVHVAEHALRTGVALRCSEPKLESFGLDLLVCGVHGVPDERGQLRRCERARLYNRAARLLRLVGC